MQQIRGRVFHLLQWSMSQAEAEDELRPQAGSTESESVLLSSSGRGHNGPNLPVRPLGYQAGCAINCSDFPRNRRWVVESAVMDLVAVSSAGATVSFGFFCTCLIIDGGF